MTRKTIGTKADAASQRRSDTVRRMSDRIAHFHGGQCPPYLAQRLRGDTERGAMVRSAGITAALKVGATAIAFCASLLYARALGISGIAPAQPG